MYIHSKTNPTLLLCCLAISMMSLSSGCRSGSFQKPDMGKLAFWKSENLAFASKNKDTPPPPARHFDPAPINGEKESKIADLDGEKLQRRFKNDINEMRAEIDIAASKLDQPIRKPYSAGTASSNNAFAVNTQSTFEAAAGNVRSKLQGFGAQAESQLSAEQNDFKAAMSNTTNSFTNEPKAQRKVANDMTQGWEDKVELPNTTSGNNQVNTSLAAVNQSLYEAGDKFTIDAKSKSDNAFKNGISAFGGSLRPMKTAVNKGLNQFSSNAQRTASQVAQGVKGFSPMGSDPATSKSTQELARVQAQMEEAKRQIEELKKQVAMAGQSQSMAPPVNRGATSNSFGPMIPTTGDNSFGATPNAGGSTNQSAPLARVAQAPLQGVGSQLAVNSSPVGTPANQLRSSQPLSPQFPQQPSTQPVSTPNYPSTSHGGYSPRSSDFNGNFSPLQAAPQNNTIATPASQVDFQSADNGTRVVTTNNAFAPNHSDSARQIQNHNSEVDIPESVLKGTGSYAPGSVSPLRSNK